MDPSRFDSLSRSLAQAKTRRGFLAGLAALGVGLLGARSTDAQVSQVSCGNQICASNPGGCKPGCVCCLYTNPLTGTVINSRCRPPGTCSPGTEAGGPAPTTTPLPATTTAAPTTTMAPTTTTTAQPTTTATPTTTAPTTTTTTAAPTCVGITPGTAQCTTSANCPPGLACVNGGCFTACAAGDPCTAGDACTTCDCVLPTEGAVHYCGDWNYPINSCQDTNECPPGSLCSGVNSFCMRPCPV